MSNQIPADRIKTIAMLCALSEFIDLAINLDGVYEFLCGVDAGDMDNGFYGEAQAFMGSIREKVHELRKGLEISEG